MEKRKETANLLETKQPLHPSCTDTVTELVAII